MLRAKLFLAGGLSLLVAITLCGCAKSKSPESGAEMEMTDADGHDHAQGEQGHQGDQEKIEAALAKLTPEERALAEAQDMVCIVSNDPLGSMGSPVLIKDVGGHDFLICCAGCEEELRKDPDKYIAKLKKPAEPPTDKPAEEQPSEEAAPAENPS
jgi:hypothetical protein